MSDKKSGFVSIIGRPNVGKSTLLNRLIGEKLAAVSPKPQTTRGMIRGILTRSEGQVVFTDTPGFHEPRDLLGEWMVNEIRKSLEGVDLLYWMVLPEKRGPYEEKILLLLKEVKTPVFLLVNQVDRFAKPEILPVLDEYHGIYPFREFIPISAKTGLQLDLLTQKTFEVLPSGEPFFPEDQVSDQQERFLVGEMIREKIFQLTSKEIPYDTAVTIESFKDRDDQLVDIHATVIVARDSQKGIIIGKNGQKLKQIGQAARYDIERFLGKRVYLELWVKVLSDWRHDTVSLKRLGFK